jgi:hypothetical protein
MSNAIKNNAANAGRSPDVRSSDGLCSLTNEQLDHVSLGLTHAFGAVLSGNAGESETFFLTLETGQLVALHARTLTVQDVWEAAEALSA